MCNFDIEMTEENLTATPREIELLAPARDAATAIAAIDHGADAVYMGAPAFGARSQAGNTLADLRSVADYAHKFRCRLYVTVNTIVYDDELEQVRQLIWDLWRAGADALIVQDLAITRMELPPIALHASTQCDTRTPGKARFLEQCGFTRLVLARELTAGEISEIRKAVSADLEVFVHGALCVSFSGDCQASFALTGRSANRGECAQICRYRFDLEDSDGNTLIKGKHLLSLRDMNRLDSLEQLLAAGASSLKIEGRLKDIGYVKNVVASYRRRLDAIIKENPTLYRRSSSGRSRIAFDADPAESFNRGFTDYFLSGRNPGRNSLATFNSPKWTGQPVGEVVRASGKMITARLDRQLNNGDGLGYFTPDGEFTGFRLNRVEGNRLFTATEVSPARGTVLYRNMNHERNLMLAGDTAVRKVSTAMHLGWRGASLVLSIRSEEGVEIEVAEAIEFQEAKSPQAERRRKELEKTGDSIYTADSVEDNAGNCFIPASRLSNLRRRGLAMLDVARKAAFRPERPGHPAENISLPDGYCVSRHDNIANRISARLYADLSGIAPEKLPKAIEAAGVRTDSPADRRVMETRYCLRRELGACLKTKEGSRLPSGLYLVSGKNRLRLEFDCRACRMRVLLDS